MFRQGDFLINQNETPESIKAKRERIAEMLSRQPTPTTYGGGIAAMISGLVQGAQNRKIDQAEAKGMGSGRRASENVFRMARGDAPISTAGDFPPPPQQESSFKPTERARQIIAGLMQRGVPQPAAAGMVGNMQIESGLNSNINEKNPLVKGSRGGFGLNQWTADRRRALEAYAQQAGKPVSDLDLQLDYTMQELNGSESGARDKVFSAKTPEEAALAYSQHFLRPGIPHNDKRVAAARSFSSLLGDNTQVASLDQSIGLPQPQPAASQQMVQAQPAPTMYQDAGTPFERPATPQPSLDMGWMQQQRANQWLSPEARSYLDGEIARQEKMNDPAAQMKQQMDNIGLQKAQLELQRLQNPQSDPQKVSPELTDIGGKRVIIDKMTGNVIKELGESPVKQDNAPSGYRKTADGNLERIPGYRDENLEMDIRKEFEAQTKDFRAVRDSYNRINSSAQNPTPAGDLSLIFNYMKMLDPGSVVRESEFSVAANAAPLLTRIGLDPEKLKGVWEGQRLTPEQRADFLNRSQELYGQQEETFKRLDVSFSELARRNGLDPKNINLIPLSNVNNGGGGDVDPKLQKYKGFQF